MEILWLEIMILVVGFEDTKYVDLNILRLGYFLYFFFFFFKKNALALFSLIKNH